ncbi:hypothetical protein GGS20DRAFT_332196 [Poronia punctata]|nr:hypothetical protein GGS20DRAFT_332196 [Poronia punctata]
MVDAYSTTQVKGRAAFLVCGSQTVFYECADSKLPRLRGSPGTCFFASQFVHPLYVYPFLSTRPKTGTSQEVVPVRFQKFDSRGSLSFLSFFFFFPFPFSTCTLLLACCARLSQDSFPSSHFSCRALIIPYRTHARFPRLTRIEHHSKYHTLVRYSMRPCAADGVGRSPQSYLLHAYSYVHVHV